MTALNGEEAPAPHRDLSKSVATKQSDALDSSAYVLPCPPGSDGEFWQCLPYLRQIRDMAHHRYVSPWSVLGVAIARVLATIPPWITLPPIIGGKASLNTFIAIVGISGIGKGASEAVGAELVTFDTDDNIGVLPAGSGEGLAHAYVHRATTGEDKGSIVRDRNACLFSVPEVDTLTSVAGRQGSTVMSKLRSAYSGEEIGFSYADPSKRLLVGAHNYRLCLVLGVQPERAEALLSESAGGTPQRFVWLPANNPQIIPGRGREREPIAYSRMASWGAYARSLTIPQVAEQTAIEAHVARHRGNADALDGHALQTRLKVMVALAALDGRTEPNEQDWMLATYVMAKSDATRADVVAAVEAAEEADAEKRGRQQGVARDAATVSAQGKKVQRYMRRIARKLAKDGQVTQRELLHSFNWAERQDTATINDALTQLAEDGLLATERDVTEAANQHVELTRTGRDWLVKNGGLVS
ncbi:hypothetical protein AAFP35_10050 [Gordonia sp. CPCC 206044]|uniref:hypothetical protein n=1 Tax=Gordonia sp. CPCC 206044 TaxID=3140793 RepID=UPI003AF3A5F6